MYLQNIKDEDLVNLLYKCSARLFPTYSDMFNGDLEEFQQQCCLLTLKHLDKYDSNKSSISTFIYNNMPLYVKSWLRSTEAHNMLYYNNNVISMDKMLQKTELDNEEKMDKALLNEYNLIDDLNDKLNIDKLDSILEKYEVLKMRYIDDLQLKDISNKLNKPISSIQYQINKEIKNLFKKHYNFLENMYIII